MVRFSQSRLLSILLILTLPIVAFGQDPIGKVRGGGNSIDWQLKTHGQAAVELVVLMPNGDVLSRTFKNGNPSLRVQELGTDLEDGVYNYELRLVPNVPSDVAKKLEKARSANDDAAARKIMKDAGLVPVKQSGAFTIQNGSIVDTEKLEEGAETSLREDSTPTLGSGTTGPGAGPGKVTVNDQVIPDDLIVQGSGCFGFDCVNNESFGFDTIRLKENNLRIKAEDTSVGSFPTNDWQLTFNDSASGGASKFSVEDITGARVPFTVEGGSPTNALFVDSTGNVGLQTAAPALDFHISSTDTPAHRFEQNNSGGFTAQTWDIGANEANFFVRDVTGGSLLSLRIRPGAPTSSLDISSDGDIGIGTGSPNDRLDVRCDSTGKACVSVFNSNATGFSGFEGFEEGGTSRFFMGVDNAANNVRLNAIGSFPMVFLTNSVEHLRLDSDGDFGINCNNPTSDLVIATTTVGCTGSVSSINAGATQFTVTSSRAMKENLAPVAVPDLLSRMEKVNVYKYDFIEGPTDRVGLMAEDFHQIFGRGSEKVIDGQEVQMALWMAVQELTKQNKELQERLEKLEAEKKQ